MRRIAAHATELYALVKTHVGEEEEYLRVLQGNLSDAEQDAIEQGLEHSHTQ